MLEGNLWPRTNLTEAGRYSLNALKVAAASLRSSSSVRGGGGGSNKDSCQLRGHTQPEKTGIKFTDLNNTDQVGHSSRVEHFIKFGGQEEMQEVVERVSQEPAEGGDELEGGVGEVAEPHGQVLHHAVHPLHGTLLGRSQAQGFQLVQLRKVVPEQYHDYQT